MSSPAGELSVGDNGTNRGLFEPRGTADGRGEPADDTRGLPDDSSWKAPRSPLRSSCRAGCHRFVGYAGKSSDSGVRDGGLDGYDDGGITVYG